MPRGLDYQVIQKERVHNPARQSRGTGRRAGESRRRPEHGQAVVVSVAGDNRYAYRAAKSYTGPDHMVIALYHRRNYRIDVTISVLAP
jgi:hypothetical protein